MLPNALLIARWFLLRVLYDTYLATHLLAHDLPGPWTAVELLRIRGRSGPIAPRDETAMTRLLNESPHFSCDPRRLFPFQATAAPETPAASHMEANLMLSLAARTCPAGERVLQDRCSPRAARCAPLLPIPRGCAGAGC